MMNGVARVVGDMKGIIGKRKPALIATGALGAMIAAMSIGATSSGPVKAQTERPRLAIAREAMALLRSHSWPGNVRELKNVIERAVVLSSGPDITAADLPTEVRQARPG